MEQFKKFFQLLLQNATEHRVTTIIGAFATALIAAGYFSEEYRELFMSIGMTVSMALLTYAKDGNK